MSAVTKKSKTPLFLLSPSIPIHHREELWGSLVMNPYKPIEHGYSSFESKKPVEMVGSIEPNGGPQTILNYEQVLDKSDSAEIRTRIESLFNVDLYGSKIDAQRRAGRVALWWYMVWPEEQLKKLEKEDDYIVAAERMFKKRRDPSQPLYFVTSMLALADMEVQNEKGRTVGAGAGVTLPDATGLPGVGFSVGAERSRLKTSSGTFVGVQIIAIGAYQVWPKTLKSSRRSLLRRFGRRKSPIGPIYKIDYEALRIDREMAEGNTRFTMDAVARAGEQESEEESLRDSEEPDFRIYAA